MIELVQWQAVPRELQFALKAVSKRHLYSLCRTLFVIHIVKCCLLQEISSIMDATESVVKIFKYSPKHL